MILVIYCDYNCCFIYSGCVGGHYQGGDGGRGGDGGNGGMPGDGRNVVVRLNAADVDISLKVVHSQKAGSAGHGGHGGDGGEQLDPYFGPCPIAMRSHARCAVYSTWWPIAYRMRIAYWVLIGC